MKLRILHPLFGDLKVNIICITFERNEKRDYVGNRFTNQNDLCMEEGIFSSFVTFGQPWNQ